MKKREFYIVSGLVMFLCMGTIYSWSVFQKPLVEALKLTYGKNISPTMASMPYTVFLFCYAFSMPVAGRFIKKVNPKALAIGGSLAISFAWILAGFADSIHFIIATYGIIGGIGVGIVYGIPMAVVTEWFPDKKGFAVGLTLLGFGLSPFITAPLANKLIQTFGVFPSFKILGVSFAVILSLLSLTLKFPDKKEDNKTISDNIMLELTPREMMKTTTFYTMWCCFVIGTFSGLMIIGLSSTYAQEIVNLNPAKAAMFTSFFAIFNGIGRPIFGALTDKLGTKKTITLSYLLIITAGVLSLLFKGNIFIFGLSFAIMWLNLGGWLAIVPASTVNLFGKSHYSANYGILFTAYGIGALSQGFVGGYIDEAFGSYFYIFYPVIAACVIGLIISNKFIGENK
ncbi:L-lactate MFS transporter [Ilyobacter polytropus]|uniref:Major facilitator superfamily MFS_1 n=1 Tax=Ilyobacter polytropus (strain ATCC 51220 / DSM 2926 / LMG 16218 / CuHBu1) TaxID=572544 RepID=E3H797_ILYPC|nr:OFA family MFS transporter [Ilyobacter polytropus]ADO82578.1 major facilitator superfamily MFS_1 [Ilyobacter polytropus DSM 2926]